MQPLVIDGVSVPRFLYGTAWKEDATERLTALALAQGFRGIDTANQRKHYFEAAVGAAVQAAIGAGGLGRDGLFLQSKFTFRRGQDHRLPYDADAPIAHQVGQSFVSTLDHFGTDHLDSYVLHGPSSRDRLRAADWQAWRAMEALHGDGRARLLGVSNVTLEQLRLLVARADVPPRFVQNRCFAARGWDRAVRRFCADHDIIYQGFSLLTANRAVLGSDQIKAIARRHDTGAQQIIFRFALDLGMVALTGTTQTIHMTADLAAAEIALSQAEVATIEKIAG